MTEPKTHFHQCPHFTSCSGCSENLSLDPPPIWGEVLSFFKDSSPVLPLFHCGSPIHWRHRAKVAVRGTPGHPLIGLYKRGTHDVFPIPDCLVHHPRLNQAFEEVRKWMHREMLSPYQEHTRKGDLRYLQGVVERQSGKIQLVFVLNTPHQNTPKSHEWQKLISQLKQENPSLWHSLWLNFNTVPTNTIFGSHWLLVDGEEFLWEAFDGIDVCYGPSSFGQANLPLFECMLIQLRNLIPIGARTAEFYAGVGAIGLFIANRCEWIRCSEINPHAEVYFEQSRACLSPQETAKLIYYTASAEKSLSTMDGASTVIVDPPRKGLDASFFVALKQFTGVQQLIYVSCGWEAFKRDCKQLCSDGWSIVSADGYHFFPGSNHVELLVSFQK